MSRFPHIAIILLLLGAARAEAQDAVEIKTNDSVPSPQVRLAITSGVTTATVWVKRSRMRFDSAGNEGYLNVSSPADASPVAGDLRFDGTNLLFYNGAWQTVATSGSATTAVILAPASAQQWSAGNPGIFINENGAGTPNLLQLQTGGVNQFVVGNSGIVTTGSWNGTAIGAVYGGTGQTAVSTGDLLYGSAANTWSRLSGPAAAGRFLRSSAANTFAWNTIQASDVPSGSANYIQNQSAAQQASSSFWISGTARLDGGTLTMGNGTSNLIDFGSVGVAAPTAASVGWKIKTWGSLYGIGIDSSTQWYSANTTHKFYTTDGTTWTERANLDSTGAFRSYLYSDLNDSTYFLDANANGAAINANANGLVLNGQLQNLSTWGMNARAQGILIMPEGTVTDDGAGNLTFGSTVIVMNPASGSWIRVAAGTYALGSWGYLWINMPPIGTRGTTVVPTVSAWADADVAYAGRDRVVLAQRAGGGAIYCRFGIPANSATGSFILNQSASNQTGSYWINGTGRLSRLGFNTVGGNSGIGGDYYSIYQESGAWSSPYPDLVIQYHTGIKYDAYHVYGGHRFYTGYDGTGTPTGLSLTVGDQRIDTPILYDQNNTAYYVDPASTTRINTLQLAGNFNEQQLLSVKGTLDTSTTSTTWVDLSEMSITFTPTQGNVLIFAKISVFSNCPNVQFRLLLDGVTVLDQVSENVTHDATTRQATVCLVYHGTLSLASHTVKIQWMNFYAGYTSYVNSATSFGDETRNLVVMEFKD